MKGIIEKTISGWFIIYDESIGENIIKKNQNSLPLHPKNIEDFDSLGKIFDNFEARIQYNNIVEFEIIDELYEDGSTRKFAKLI
jgi:hypothetical protein